MSTPHILPGGDMEPVKPMLAARADALFLRRLMRSPEWVAELKLDGSRYVGHFEKDGVHFFSRRTSVKTGELVEKTAQLPHLNKPVKHLTGTVVDGELMVMDTRGSSNQVTSIVGSLPSEALRKMKADGYLFYWVFDVLFYRGKDIQSLPFKERTEYRRKVVAEWANDYVKRITYSGDKQTMLQKAIEGGYEGLILKHIKSPYIQNARSKSYWVKVKKEADFSVVIMGFTDPVKDSKDVDGRPTINRFWKEGWFSAIRFGVYKRGKLIEIGQTSGISDALRKEMSENKKKFLGQVIDVTGQEILVDAIRHPRFVRFRDDIDPEECTWESVFNQTQKQRYK